MIALKNVNKKTVPNRNGFLVLVNILSSPQRNHQRKFKLPAAVIC